MAIIKTKQQQRTREFSVSFIYIIDSKSTTRSTFKYQIDKGIIDLVASPIFNNTCEALLRMVEDR